MSHGRYFTLTREPRGRGRGRRGGGHRNRNSDEGEASGSWAKTEKRGGLGAGGRDKPPPDLRGRDLGLFFRDRARERYQKRISEGESSLSTQNKEVREKRELTMSLNIPTGALKRIEKQLLKIHEKREDEISFSGVFRRPKNYVKENDPFEETKVCVDSANSSRTGKYDDVEPRNDSVLMVVTHEALNEHVGSTNSNIIRFDSNGQADVNIADDTTEGECVLMESETPLVEVDDESELKPLDKTIMVDSDDDCYVYEPPRPSGPRLRPFYLDEVTPECKKFPWDGPVPKQEKIDTPKTVPWDFVPLRSLAPRWTMEDYIDDPKEPVSRAPRSTTEDNMDDPKEPVKEEVKDEWVISVTDAPYRPLPVKHEGQQYKYGYYDLITGSFMEKLEESLSNGVSINVRSPEMDKLSEDYYGDYVMKANTTKYKEMLKFRERLPAYKKRKDLLEQINSSQVIVISGETGCGKSTQVPQIILDDAILNKRGANVKVLVTQPRRIAASSLAARVSEERAEGMGESVGYVVRLEKVEARARGSVTYCTTGVLLADLEVRQAMSDVSHIILDEVHERDCNVDLAMCMLKQVISKRKDLKLILMSATLDAESLSKYFDNCPTMHIEGLAFPVTDIYLEEILKLTGYTLPDPQANSYRRKQMNQAQKDAEYAREVGPILHKRRAELGDKVYRTLLDQRIENLNVDLIFALLSHICEGGEGAVLVFVPGFSDITKLLEAIHKSSQFPSHRYDIHPLHSKLSSAEQKRIFNRPPKGVRKIVIATNIAETSITIDDVVYVIDSAKMKVTGLSATDNISTLTVEWVSQANLRQRRGRAGRVQAGVCYHLISSFRAEKLPTRLLPELQRSNLLEPVLTVKKLRLGLAEDALSTVPDPPAPGAVRWAVQHLKRLGALDDTETLTPLGWHLARLPVHPAAGKLLLFGALFGCLDRAASVAASWGFKDPFLLVIGKEKEADAAKRELALGEPSDHVAISEAVRRWETLDRRRKDFAWEHFLSPNTLNLLSAMKKQFADNLRSMGFLPDGNIRADWENRNSDNLSVFKAVVAAALYPQFGTVKWIGLHRPNHRIIVSTPEDGKVDVHPGSTLATPRVASGRGGQFGKRICSNPGANWHVYWIKQRTSKLFLLDLTLVHTMPLVFFGELNLTEDPSNSQNSFIDISTVRVRCNNTAVRLLVQLRNLLDEVLASKVASPDGVKQHGEFEENVLNAVIELITAEDEQTNYMDYETDESDKSDSVDVVVLD